MTNALKRLQDVVTAGRFWNAVAQEEERAQLISIRYGDLCAMVRALEGAQEIAEGVVAGIGSGDMVREELRAALAPVLEEAAR